MKALKLPRPMQNPWLGLTAGLLVGLTAALTVLPFVHSAQLEIQGLCDWMPCAGPMTYMSIVVLALLTAAGLFLAVQSLIRLATHDGRI
jgi:hypothetical protein